MRVLITGGTGFIGSALCRRYVSEGHQVRTLAKTATHAERRNAHRLTESGVEVVLGDVANRQDVAAAVDGVDLVHHIAAAMRETDIGREGYWNVNVEGTRHVLEEASRSGVKQVVHCSSVGVYGDISGRKVNEKSPCQPNNIYGQTKLAAEKLVRDFVAADKLAVVIVRPAEIYGPGDFRLLKLFRMIQKGSFFIVGNGEGHHHLGYIEDIVAAMMIAGQRPELSGKTFILAGDEPIKLNQLILEIARQLQVRPPRLRLPLGPMLAVAAMVEFPCRGLGIRPPIYRRRMDFFRHDWNLDISACRNVLGYTPQFDLRSGIARTIEGYRQAGLLS